MTGAVVLAAGGSTRMGRPKALLRLPDGRSLLRAWLDVLGGQAQRLVVVGGAETEALARELRGQERLVVNRRWRETGPLESLRLGCAALDCARLLVTPVDLPPPGAGELARLCLAPGSAVLGWRGKPGHPVLLAQPELSRLRGGEHLPQGLRTLVGAAPVIEADSAQVLLNLNRPEQWRAWVAGL